MNPLQSMETAPTFETLFDQSYERVRTAKQGNIDFFDAFYMDFLGRSPEIRNKFRKTDMKKQRSMLEKSFYHLLVFYATGDADDYMQRMVERHRGREVDISNHLYDMWMDALIDTVAKYDDEFTDETALAWRLVMAPGLTYMKYK
ncbi:globin [Agaribacterium sp. ZY112]|uniref:globin n=1 Tax=Agaribacterium sp. ZY112 TaxID=3233574 RepID=UPI0035262925